VAAVIAACTTQTLPRNVFPNASLDTVVKAQVYLRDQEDIPGFRQVWARLFPVEPATTIIATEKDSRRLIAAVQKIGKLD
jgi:enamine deaminase RidA (YjgF/YER057c/UK114 family)